MSGKVELPGPIDLTKVSIEEYKKNFKSLLSIAIVPVAISFGSLFAGGIGVVVTSLFSESLAYILTIPFLIFLGLVMVVVSVWGQIALIHSVINNSSFKEAFKATWGRRILSYVWISVLAALIVSGGYLLFIIPGVILSVWFSMSLLVFVSEDKLGLDVLIKSKEYVSKNWWGVFGRLMFFMVIYFVVYFPAKFLGDPDTSFLPSLYQTVVSLFMSPFVYIYLNRIYKALKKDGKEENNAVTGRGWFYVLAVLGVVAIAGLVVLLGIIARMFVGDDGLPNYTMVDEMTYEEMEEINKMMEDAGYQDGEGMMLKANDANRKVDQLHVKIALQAYEFTEGEYPASLSSLVPDYIDEVPADPDTGESYRYTLFEDGEYQFCIDFEETGEECITSYADLESPDELSPQF